MATNRSYMDKLNTLEKVGALAEGALKSIQAEAEAKSESKGADLKKETEGIDKIEAQAAEDERILTLDDKELSESEAKRKTEILETQEKKAKSPEDKIKRTQEASQKRIDEIKSELLAEQNKRKQDAEAIKKLQEELAEVKKTIQPKVELDEKARLKQVETERIAKYVEEDKTKPREDRREMNKEDLEAWYLEDPIEATDWINARRDRRVEEARKAKEDETKKSLANDFVKKQAASKDKLFAKYPGTNPPAERLAELKGKSRQEIVDILSSENEEFKLSLDIVAEHPDWVQKENGPELVMAEMEKRLSGKSSENAGNPGKNGKLTFTQEELDAKIQAEIDRRNLLEGEGVNSTKGKKPMDKETQKSALREKQEKIAKKANISIEALDKQLDRRKKYGFSGSGGGDKDE